MRRIIERVIHSGLNRSVAHAEERYVIVINSMALVTVLLTLLNLPLTIFFFPDATYLHLILLLNAPAFSLVILLNLLGWRLAARLYFNLYGLCEMALTAWALGIETEAHLLILLIIVAAFFQYPPW